MSTTERLLYPVAEAAQKMGIGRTTTFNLIRAGELESVRLGGKRLVPADAIDTFVARLRDSGK